MPEPGRLRVDVVPGARPPGRETIAAKGRRYLTEGRIILTHVAGSTVRARARGRGSTYTITHHEGAGWHCTCPALRRCAHLEAVGLITNAGPLP